MRWLWFEVVVVICLVSLCGCTQKGKFNAQEEIADGTTKGEQIVQALEAYHAANGRYPGQLQDLVPSYIVEVPATMAEKEYEFRLSQSDIFCLSFPVTMNAHVGSGTICTYIKRLEVWDCSQSFEME